MDIEKELLKIIEKKENVFFEIERVLFTKRYNLSKKHYEIFSIQSISMIYSIWEGFIQQAFQLYIDKINSLNIDCNKLGDEIRIFHIENSFKQFNSYPTNQKKKIEFYTNLENFFSKKQHIIFSHINTQSNVNFNVLNMILESFCLIPFEEYWKNYKHPKPNLKESIKTLVNYRNGIAHGGDINSEEKITQFVYSKHRTLILDLMYEIRNKMIQGIENESYYMNKYDK
jgi:hypothetical protein